MQEPEVINLANHYHKALDEIEEIVNDFSKEGLCFYDDFDCNDCDLSSDCNYLRRIKILNIISKAKGEDNAG